MTSSIETKRINFKTLTITSLIFGFLLIPVHEFGHVLCDWLSGHPAAMSYARDYLLSGGNTPFLGLLGGPALPLILSTIAIVQIFRGVNVSLFYPVAILGTVDRLLLYLSGSLPSDERDLAQFVGWNAYSFKYIFFSLEVFLLVLILILLYRLKINPKHAFFVFLIPLISFAVGASVGVFVIEQYVFPQQFKLQFG